MLSTRLSCIRRLPALVVRSNATQKILCRKNQVPVLSSVTFNNIPRGSRLYTHILSPTKEVQEINLKHFWSQPHENSTLLNVEMVGVLPRRFTGSYFQKNTSASNLWKSATGVSTQGRKRGRGKGLMKIKNLNRGQKLGFGRERIRFPGLTVVAANKDRGKAEIGQISEEEHKTYIDGLLEIQTKKLGTRRKKRQTPMERGWTGASPQGRKFGPPIAKNPELTFDNFESILILYRNHVAMTGVFGRVRSLRMMMVTGNKNGTAGFALSRAAFGRGPQVFQKAVNRAGLKLCHIPRYENRTVYHDFFTNFGHTRIMVQQKPPGYGIRAHRLIVSICELIGIKDLYAKVEGGHINYNHMCKAFFLGLLRQRTHQELANEKRLHLVEFRKENYNFPKVVASPDDGHVRTKDEIQPNEILDFQMIAFDGNLPLFKEKPRPFYEKLPSWSQRLKKIKPQEHHLQHRIDMLVEHGREQSQYTDVFPECVSTTEQRQEYWSKLNKRDKNQ